MYTSHPSAPMERPEALHYLWTEYMITDIYARDLLDRARASESGMAMIERHLSQKVWATHMTTLGGKFIIELE
jgi:hypothetical protein